MDAHMRLAPWGMHSGDKLAQLTSERREACFDDFLTGLGEFFDSRAIEFPHVSNVVTARA